MAYNGDSSLGRRRRARRTLRKRDGNGNGKGLPFWLKLLIGFGALAFAGLAVMAAVAFAVYQGYADDLVAPDELAINQPSYGARIYDRNGVLLYEFIDKHSGLRRPVRVDEVSEAFLAATIATEDDSFFTNPGVNIKGLLRAAWENFSPLGDAPGVLEGSGGSSITQQLVKNVYIPQEERQKRSISRKIKETVYAIELTRKYEKEQILEWYINQISYGGIYNGVQAASLGYFGKPASELTLAEAALLAGIPQSPAAYNPIENAEAARERRDQILDLMLRKGAIQIGDKRHFTVNAEDVAHAKEEPIGISRSRFECEACHFVFSYVQPQLEMLFGSEALVKDGLIVTTTLDLKLQHAAEANLEKWIREFENVSNSRNGAVVVADPKTGEILTMVGSRDYFNPDLDGNVNNALACNSPGSSFKPFAYLTAFLELGWGPGTVILDTPVTYVQPDGTEFEPVNPNKSFAGPITIRNALGNSLNVPAVKTAAAVGAPKIVDQARRMGFVKTFRSWPAGCQRGGYGPAIATGGVDVTLEEMVFGYTVFANGGVMRGQTPFVQNRQGERKIDPVSILKVEDALGRVRFDVNTRRQEERVVQEEYTYLVTSILTDPQAQCIIFGCGGITVPGYTVAVKTGTSEPFDPKGPKAGKIGETWAFGYTPDVVVGIWAGNSDNAPIVNIFSTSISFRAMRDTVLSYYDGRRQTAFTRPEGIVEETVCVPSGLRPSSLCGRTTKDIWVKDKVPANQDSWWQRVRIDVRNGLLATASTPSQYVSEQVMLVLPRELLQTEEQQRQAKEWAETLGLPLAPSETSSSSSELPVVIFSPSPGAAVSGTVQVQGRAASADFRSYRLEYGPGLSPASWTIIGQGSAPVQNGTLGVWNTAALPRGTYTLQLTVVDGQRGNLTARVTVNVGLPAPTPTPTPRPNAP
jgi:membrane peptidoglycan carboxypeptidase